MTDKPIVFSGPMVRALLAGTKTQTRRALKSENVRIVADLASETLEDLELRGWETFDAVTGVWASSYAPFDPEKAIITLVPLEIGDRLWVREMFARIPVTAYDLPKTVDPTDPDMAAHYRVDFDRSGKPAWKPSIHMPRWASRLTLTVTDVRVQRLQDCSAGDALAEGVTSTEHWRPKDVEGKPFEGKWWDDFTFWANYPQKAYRDLWEAINGSNSWDANPWVAAYNFTVERGNIDQLARAAA
jgi:hypothetical protein